MRRLLACVLLLCVAVPAAGAPERAAQIAWFDDIDTARKVAADLGRPLLIAVHARLAPEARAWPRDPAEWAKIYADERIVSRSRAFCCVVHLVGRAPEPERTVGDQRPEAGSPFLGPLHLLLDASGTHVLGRADSWSAAPGESSVEALLGLLDRALSRADPVGDDVPVVDAALLAKQERPPSEGDALDPVGLSLESPGIRIHLAWPLPLPAPGGKGEPQALRAAVQAYVDGEGPLDLGVVPLQPGEPVDVPVDLRFDDHPGLRERLEKGAHRVDVYIEPAEDSFVFSAGPLHVGLVWIELGDGGGGGGGAQQQPQPEPQQPSPEKTGAGNEDEEPETPEPPTPPTPARPEVVEPFIRDGEEIMKDDAIVGVEDDNAALKPPPAQPGERPLRDFEKQLEGAVGWERIPPAERAFLLRYFRSLRRLAEEGEGGK